MELKRKSTIGSLMLGIIGLTTMLTGIANAKAKCGFTGCYGVNDKTGEPDKKGEKVKPSLVIESDNWDSCSEVKVPMSSNFVESATRGAQSVYYIICTGGAKQKDPVTGEIVGITGINYSDSSAKADFFEKTW